MKNGIVILCALALFAAPVLAADPFEDLPDLDPPPGSEQYAEETPSTTQQQTTTGQQQNQQTATQTAQGTNAGTNTTTGSNNATTAGSGSNTGSSGGNNAGSATATQTSTETTAATTSDDTVQPLEEDIYVNNEQTTPVEEEPATIALPENALLYGLLGVVAILVLTIGTLVVGVVKRHHEGAEATKTLVHDQDLSRHVIGTGSDAATLVHHPSIDEARTFIGMLRSRGYTDAQIRDHFSSHGWTDEQIAMAMRH